MAIVPTTMVHIMLRCGRKWEVGPKKMVGGGMLASKIGGRIALITNWGPKNM